MITVFNLKKEMNFKDYDSSLNYLDFINKNFLFLYPFSNCATLLLSFLICLFI